LKLFNSRPKTERPERGEKMIEEETKIIELGQKAKDKITQFEGILIARIEYLFGCNQYCIAPQAKDGEIKDSQWFDVGRIEIIGPGVTAEEVRGGRPGGVNRDCPKGVI